MVQLIKPSEVKVVTKDGECKISLTIDLNINLNTAGVSVGAQVSKLDSPQQQEKEKEKTHWEIPDFGAMPKLNFGKKA